MFKYLRKRKGQSTLETAVLIMIVIGALLSIQVYIKRGVQGRLRSAADDIGEQYSAGNTNVYKKVTVTSNTTETNDKGEQSTFLRADEKTITNMSANLVNLTYEYWGK